MDLETLDATGILWRAILYQDIPRPMKSQVWVEKREKIETIRTLIKIQ